MTSDGTTPSSPRTFLSSGRWPVPESRPIFPVLLGLIRPVGPTGPRLTLACQSGCLQSTVKAIPLIIRLACLSYVSLGSGAAYPRGLGRLTPPPRANSLMFKNQSELWRITLGQERFWREDVAIGRLHQLPEAQVRLNPQGGPVLCVSEC